MAGLFDQFNAVNKAPLQTGTWDAGNLFGTALQPSAGLGAPMATTMTSPAEVKYMAPGTGQSLEYAGNMQVPYMLAHEQEHVLESRAKNRYGSDFNLEKAFTDALTSLESTGAQKTKTDLAARNLLDFRKNLGKKEVINYLKKSGIDDAYLTNYEPIGSARVNFNPLSEVLASLSGFETAKKTDITTDPFLRKTLFNDDPKLIEAYKAVTGLRQERLDARDLPPYTADKTKIPKDTSLFEDLSNSLLKRSIK